MSKRPFEILRGGRSEEERSELSSKEVDAWLQEMLLSNLENPEAGPRLARALIRNLYNSGDRRKFSKIIEQGLKDVNCDPKVIAEILRQLEEERSNSLNSSSG